MRTIFSFRVGGVQEFIDSARTTDDFAISSYLVSHLAAKSAAKLMERSGVELIFPAKMVEPPQFPNGFLAIVPGDAAGMAKEVDAAFHQEWERIYYKVRDAMPGNVRHHWRRRKVFETFWATAPCDGRPYREAYNEVSGLIEARKTLRDFQGCVEENVKCSQCGKYEALQPHTGYNWTLSREFSQDLAANPNYFHRFRAGEHLCPVCTTCRLARRTVFDDSLKELFPSTSSIAVRPFLSHARQLAETCKAEMAAFTAAVRGFTCVSERHFRPNP